MLKKILLLVIIISSNFLLSLTKIDSLKSNLETASDIQKIFILEQLQEEFWAIYPQASLEYCKQSIKLATKLKKNSLQVKGLSNYAKTYKILKDYSKAIIYYKLTLDKAEEIDAKVIIISTLLNLAEAYLKQNDNVEAFDYALQASNMSKEFNDMNSLGKSRLIISDIYKHLNEFDKAMSNYKVALELFKKTNDPTSQAVIHEKMAHIYKVKNDIQNFRNHYNSAISIYIRTDDKEALLRSYETYGLFMKANDLIKESNYYFTKYAEINEEIERDFAQNKDLYYYEYYTAKGNTKKALSFYKNYQLKQDSLKSQKTKKDIDNLIGKVKNEFEKETDKLKSDIYSKDSQIKQIKEEADKIKSEQKKVLEEVNRKKQIIAKLESDTKKKSEILQFMNKRKNEFLVEVSNELMESEKKLEQLATTDHLTKLPNRRSMVEKLNYQQKRYERNKKPFSVVIADIDDFKEVNDNFGHECGDHVLKSISDTFRSMIRQQDICARWGGEEFLFLFPETDEDGAEVISNKIRKKIEKTIIIYNQKEIDITVSFGIAQYSYPKSINNCIANADSSLYAGKRSGKNKVVCASILKDKGVK